MIFGTPSVETGFFFPPNLNNPQYVFNGNAIN